jgi:hypothetical protein
MNSVIGGFGGRRMSLVRMKVVRDELRLALMIGLCTRSEDLDARYNVCRLSQVSSGVLFVMHHALSMHGRHNIQCQRKCDSLVETTRQCDKGRVRRVRWAVWRMIDQSDLLEA